MIRFDQPQAQRELETEPGEGPDIKGYVQALVGGVSARRAPDEVEPVAMAGIPSRVFEVLTRREFCYLGKGRAAAYREPILALVAAAVAQDRPMEFYYDIGGGYHASTWPGEEEVSFDVGLSELFVLSQISRFGGEIARFYRPGVNFHLVIDNLCAHLINDIPLAETLGYCARVRHLISQVGMADVVGLLVESEHVSVDDFDRVRSAAGRRQVPAASLSAKERENVERFLGRPCDEGEAAERAARYREVIEASELLIAPLIRGVHMTQRATPATICFRPFPGGDSRIQCGQVVLAAGSKQRLHPVLLTSRNRHEYSCARYPVEMLGQSLPFVTYAERIQESSRIGS